MEIVSKLLPGCYLLRPKVIGDVRGSFVKTFQSTAFAGLGIDFVIAEEYYSTSHAGVVRGMHFQLPPHDHDKMVYCTQGRVLDVILDLRAGSPFFGAPVSVELSGDNRLMLFIPTGVAHGFCSLENESLMVYKTSTCHAPAHDAGNRWDSFGFDWPVQEPLVSTRDSALPRLADFSTPFNYVAAQSQPS